MRRLISIPAITAMAPLSRSKGKGPGRRLWTRWCSPFSPDGLTKEGFIGKIAKTPKEKKIELDKIGSIVWELCDGKRTVKDIAKILHERYKLLLSEAEISLNTYFNSLSKRGLMGFVLPEKTRARFEEISK